HAFSLGIWSASAPVPSPMYQVTLGAPAAHPSPPATTVGRMVGTAVAAGVSVAAAAAAAGVSVGAVAAAGAGVSVAAAAAGAAGVAVGDSPPQAASNGKSMIARAASQTKRDFSLSIIFLLL